MHHDLDLTPVLCEFTRFPVPPFPDIPTEESPVPRPTLPNQKPLIIPGVSCRDCSQSGSCPAFEVTFADQDLEEMFQRLAVFESDIGRGSVALMLYRD